MAEEIKVSAKQALNYHKKYGGKIEVFSKSPIIDQKDLSLAYTPGVAEPSREIAENPEKIYEYTSKGNLVAVVTDGSAVLGLGSIGAKAALPVMEGKCALFKVFAGVDAFPIALEAEGSTDIIDCVKKISPTFGGVNLEDIKAPRCFEVEEKLKKELDIPVFHDDQHGTAVVVLAALINTLKVVGKKPGKIKVVITGAGAAGIAIHRILRNYGVRDITVTDSRGVINKDREDLNEYKKRVARESDATTLNQALVDCDVFIGVSKKDILSKQMVESMGGDPIIFALANPDPEIKPELAKEGGAKIVATGRSDYPNQINNVLGFPGIFRGCLDIQAKAVTEGMKLAAAHALAELVAGDQLNEEYIIPDPFDERVAPHVAEAVAEAGLKEGVARRRVSPESVRQHTHCLVNIGHRTMKEIYEQHLSTHVCSVHINGSTENG
ncbi:MAG: NAD-dependent malic enzyme [Candidatus Altiarchaeales archaeon]|nr:NAD-dependent malic enzyme [Candidatus Altiarchaeales archaeon]